MHKKQWLKGKNAVVVEMSIDKSHPTNRIGDIVLDKIEQGSLRGLSIGWPWTSNIEITALDDEVVENYDSYAAQPEDTKEEDAHALI